MVDRTAALAVLAEGGWRLLLDATSCFDEVRSRGGDAQFAAASRLAKRRPDSVPLQRAAALELCASGADLARKLGLDERLLAVQDAVPQASPGRIASWHASQIPADARVLEIGCGVGADTLALSARARNVIACDVDPVRAACAHHNLMTLERGGARATPGDGFELLEGDAARATVIYADPDRRPHGRRELSSAAWRPSLASLVELARPGRDVYVRAAPSLDPEELPRGCRALFVSYHRSCMECFVVIPGERGTEPARVGAALLPERAAAVYLDGARGRAPVKPLGDVLLVPDPAAMRAGLLAELCRLHGVGLVSPGIAWMSGPTPVATPWLRSYVIEERLSLATKPLIAALRRRSPREVRAHVRGVAQDAASLAKRLKRAAGGAGPALDVFATRLDDQPAALIARPVALGEIAAAHARQS